MRLIKGERVKDGAGVNLNRVIAISSLDHADPFFLLDEFRSNDNSDYAAGFPMHPHRGIETITYMIDGSFTHRDSKGNEGNLKSGEVQWMTAGKGILHEEMPAMENGQLWGYQLWVNLPAKYKMVEPKYRHIKAEEIPQVLKNGIGVKIIAGVYDNTVGPIKSYIPVDYMDVRLNGGCFEKETRETALVYVHSGKVTVSSEEGKLEIEAGDLCLIERAYNIQIHGENSGVLYISADPLKEPVARYGPFVMNTMDEILKAIDDFNDGSFDK